MDLESVKKSVTEPATSPEEPLHQVAQSNTGEFVSGLARRLTLTSQPQQQTIDEDSSDVSTSTAQPTPQSSVASTDLPTYIRPEEVGYFDPDYQSEEGTNGPIVSVGKYVWFRDVYIFVTRLQDFVAQGKDIKSIITSCLRGSALMWYLAELSEEERAALRNNADLERWYELLIRRFKVDTCIAMSQLLSPSSCYTLANARHNPPRVWALYMLHLAKSAGFDSTYKQLNILWNQLDCEIRRDVPKPKPGTLLTTFLDDMDSKLPILLKIADRQSFYNQPELSQPPPQSQQQNRGGYGAGYSQSFPIHDGSEQPYLGNRASNGKYAYCEDADDGEY